MDYRELAKDLLKRKNNLLNAKKAIADDIEELEHEKLSCKTSSLNNMPVKKNDPQYEERLLNIIARLEDNRFRLRIVERDLKMIENGMKGLDEYQAQLLECFFVQNTKGAADSLMGRFYKERSCLYDDRNRALENFTRSVFGVIMI